MNKVIINSLLNLADDIHNMGLTVIPEFTIKTWKKRKRLFIVDNGKLIFSSKPYGGKHK